MATYLHVSKSLSSILDKQFFNDVFSDGVEVPRPLHSAVQNLLVYTEGVFIVEWRVAD